MCNVDTGYKYSIEVLLNLNHDRYKTYFTQFMVLHLGIFTAMNADSLSSLIQFLAVVGILLSVIWFMVLRKVAADIKKLWRLIEDHEKPLKQSIKVHKSQARLYSAYRMMLLVPILFSMVHIAILIVECLNK